MNGDVRTNLGQILGEDLPWGVRLLHAVSVRNKRVVKLTFVPLFRCNSVSSIAVIYLGEGIHSYKLY